MRILPKQIGEKKPETLMSTGVPLLSMPIVSFTDEQDTHIRPKT
jgi:hypothetical protein